MDSRLSGEDMEEAHERPRVRIPSHETERQKFGHNAWAQEKQKTTQPQSKQGISSNEASESPAELPQMIPTTPKTPKSADLATLNPPKQRPNIKPVTPLKLNKNRAATDPPLGSAVPPPLFAGRKAGIAELRHKFSKDGSNTVLNVGGIDVPPLPAPSDKVARVLGAQSTAKGKTGRAPPTSAPASTNAPEPYRTSTDEQHPSRHGSPQRQVKSTPVPGLPTSRFFNENPGSRPSGSASASSQKTYETAPKDYSKPGPRAEAMILGDGKLSPNKSGAYGRMANVEMQEHPARVSSMVGVVENVQQSMEGGEADPAYYPHGTRSQEYPHYDPQYNHPPLSAHALPESIYSPSVYRYDSGVSAGEWEALQQQYPLTLPPFSPRQPPLSHLQVQAQAQAQTQSQQHAQSRDVSTASSNTLPFLFRGYAEEITPTTATHPMYSSQHPQSFILPPPPPRPSRAQQPTTGSHAPEAAPPAAAPSAYGNFVPTPPHPHFRPSSSSTLTSTVIDEHLGAFAIELHHHIEMSSRRLLNALEARTDRLGDDVARGFESLGEAQRESVGEVGRRVEEEGRRSREEVLGEVGKGEERVVQVVERVGSGVGEVVRGLRALVERMGALEAWVKDVGCRCGEGSNNAGGEGGKGKEAEKEKEKDKSKPPFHKRAFSRTTNPPTSPTKTNTHPTATAAGAGAGATVPYPTDLNTTTTATGAPPSISTAHNPTRRNLLAADIVRHQTHLRTVPEPDLSLHPAFQTTQHQQSHQYTRSQPHSHSHSHSHSRSRDAQLGLSQAQGQGQGQGRGWSDEGVSRQGGGAGDGQGERGERGGIGDVVFQAPSWGEGGWYRQAYGS